jgi:hypothetical protein
MVRAQVPVWGFGHLNPLVIPNRMEYGEFFDAGFIIKQEYIGGI